MHHRIALLLKEENLTAGRLADLLGVQPSSISHVMSGRNKPGFDFIASVLRHFPAINPDWLILGEGEMYRKTISEPDFPEVSHALFSEIPEKSSLADNLGTRQSLKEEPPFPEPVEKSAKQTQLSERQIEKIVVFYTDRTYEAYMEKPFI